MRIRKANEAALQKLLQFLRALQLKADGSDYQDCTSSDLHAMFKVSKSTYSVCKKLGIVKETKDGLEYMKENPNRETCLQVLGVLLEQKKKEVLTPISQEWTALNEILQNISDKITIGINNRSLAKTSQKEVSLFSDQEKKDRQRFELMRSIATGVYECSMPFIMNTGDTASIESTNSFILEATDHLLSLYNKK